MLKNLLKSILYYGAYLMLYNERSLSSLSLIAVEKTTLTPEHFVRTQRP